MRWRGPLPHEQQRELEEYARGYVKVFSKMQFIIIRAQLIQLDNNVRLGLGLSHGASYASHAAARCIRDFLRERKDVDYFVEWYEAEAEAHLDRRDANMLPEHIVKTEQAMTGRKRELCGLYRQALEQLAPLQPRRPN